MLKIINSKAEFEQETAKGEVAIDFNATWCGPCQMLKPIIEKVAEEHPEMTILSVDVDQVPEAAEKFGVYSIPTLVVLKDGQEVRRQVGYMPEPGVKKFFGLA